MSRSNSYYSADSACSQAESAVNELQNAINDVNARIGTISFYWKGEAGTAMQEGLTVWLAKANTLVQRMNVLTSQMRSSQQYDYALWSEEDR